MILQIGKTSRILYFLVLDSTGAPVTGLAYNTAGLTIYYARDTASASVAVTLATMTKGTWVSGGLVEMDSVYMPGVYQFGAPNSAFATGAFECVFTIKSTTGRCSRVIRIVAVDLDDALRMGMTALPTAVAGGSGGIITAYSPASGVLAQSALQAGSTASALVLNASASAVTDFYKGHVLCLISGTGIGQSSTVTAYNGTTKVATVVPALAVVPAAGDSFMVLSGSVNTDAAGNLKTTPQTAVTVSTNNDKTGYALVASEHTAIQTDVSAALTTQGYTSARATNIDNLDATVSSRLATAGYTAPLNDAAIQTDVIAALTTQGYTSARATKIDNLDATVSSRLATAGYTAPLNDAAIQTDVIAALTTQGYTSARAAKVDNLDATVSSRLATAGYVGPLTAQQTRDAMLLNRSGYITNLSQSSIDSTLYRIESKITSGASTLTKQDVADAMNLSPSAGAAAPGAVQDNLATIVKNVINPVAVVE